MKGKEFNNLIKTISILKVDEVPVSKVVNVIDDPHVMLMIVKTLDGSPVFGVEGPGILLYDLIVKLQNNIEYVTSLSENSLDLVSENGEYRFGYDPKTQPYKVKVPKLELPYYVNVPAKTVQEAVKAVNGVHDYVTMEGDGESLKMVAMKAGTVVKITLGKTSDRFNVKLPFDYVKKLAKVTTGIVRMEFETDYPTRWTWNDGYYEYTALLAPRVERE